MLKSFLLAILLAQADDFIAFKRCYLDITVSPAQFRSYNPRHRIDIGRDSDFIIRRSAVLYISEPEAHIAGIHCVRIATASGSAFVQGSFEDIAERVQIHD